LVGILDPLVIVDPSAKERAGAVLGRGGVRVSEAGGGVDEVDLVVAESLAGADLEADPLARWRPDWLGDLLGIDESRADREVVGERRSVRCSAIE
jgi:hypothetical protein